MNKALFVSGLLVLVIFLDGCLGMQKVPRFIRDTGVKTNQWQISKEHLESLPKGSWTLLDLGYSSDAVKVDVMGNSDLEVLRSVVHRKGLVGTKTALQIWSGQGKLLRTIPAAGYLTFFQAANIDDDQKKELILYNYPSPLGKTIEIFKADGTLLYSWDSSLQGYFDVVDWNGSPHILSIEENAFAILSMDGVLVSRLAAPQAQYFRQIRGKQLSNGSLAILVSGDGYRPYHMVCIFDDRQELVFQEVVPGHAIGLLTAPDQPGKILISQGKDYYKYSSEQLGSLRSSPN